MWNDANSYTLSHETINWCSPFGRWLNTDKLLSNFNPRYISKGTEKTGHSKACTQILRGALFIITKEE